MQIAKLRFFISLIIDQNKVKGKENFGIRSLPNLETKFVAANTLIGLDKPKNGQSLLKNLEIERKEGELKQLRHQYFSAKTRSEKNGYQKQDKLLRKEISVLLINDGWNKTTAQQIVSFDPYNQNNFANWFDPEWMFGLVDGFDIVIGNPPYGANFSEEDKKLFGIIYESAKTVKGIQKGSLDSFSLFIDKGLSLCNHNANLAFIVPLAVTSSESMTALHKIIYKTCEKVKISTYSNRPHKIFDSADQRVAIIILNRNNVAVRSVLTTKVNKRYKNISIQNLIDSLNYIDSINFLLDGRIPKIGSQIEINILRKLFGIDTKLKDLFNISGSDVYYRSSGGRYYNIVTTYTTGSTKEKSIIVQKKYQGLVGSILTSNLYYWFYTIYSNNLDLKSYELEVFPIPLENFDETKINEIQSEYKLYLEDLEKNARTIKANYANISSFKEYRARKSKHIIDRIDDLICPLYGLNQEEIDFIKNYEIDFRLQDEEID